MTDIKPEELLKQADEIARAKYKELCDAEDSHEEQIKINCARLNEQEEYERITKYAPEEKRYWVRLQNEKRGKRCRKK